ncbi:MAG: lysylphosphatidylglycerol synthase domain-containing protein, partial [Bacteroidota bacterium]|nr:lysylphosphatidylglycerol synthase domain-containing protein [Bacteroidota bacterium]
MEISFFNKKIKLPKHLYWREILSVLFLMIGIYFFHKERREVANIIPFLHTANKSWLLVATLITFVFVLFESLMYVSSFRAINKKLSLQLCIELFLKRSFLSVFLPGGGVSALAYIPKSVKLKIKDKLSIYQASGLFGFAGVLSTFIISIVVVATSFNQNKNQNETTMGLLLLALFIFALFYLMYAVRKETKLFRWVQQKYPKAATRVKEIGGANVNAKQYIYTIVSSLGVEFCGIAHLYVAMLAVHAHPSLQAAGLAYVVSVLLMVASPFLRGVG